MGGPGWEENECLIIILFCAPKTKKKSGTENIFKETMSDNSPYFGERQKPTDSMSWVNTK